MKRFFLSLALLAAAIGSAQASVDPSPNDSWEEIFRKAAFVSQPQYARSFGPRGILNICIDGDKFRSIQPFEQCTDPVYAFPYSASDYELQHHSPVCARPVHRHLEISRIREVIICVERATRRIDTSLMNYDEAALYGNNLTYEVCVREEPRSITLPTIESLGVHVRYIPRDANNWGDDARPFDPGTRISFYKAYTIPNCGPQRSR
jgi:hypothetical protein